MHKNEVILGLAFSIVLSIAGMAFGQTRRQIAVDPQWGVKMARIHRLGQAMKKAFEVGNFTEAETYARQCIALYPALDPPYRCLAESLTAQGKTQDALNVYKVLADQGSADPKDLLPYSQVLLKTGHWAQAVAAFNKVLPSLSDPFSGSRAAIISRYGHFSAAMPQPRELETALHIALGLSYEKSCDNWGQSQDSKALTEYAQAYALSPTSAVATLFEGRRLWKLHRFAEANITTEKARHLGDEETQAAIQHVTF